MDIDYNTLTDLAGADGHILNLDYYGWTIIDYRRTILYGIEPLFGHPLSAMYDYMPRCSMPIMTVRNHWWHGL